MIGVLFTALAAASLILFLIVATPMFHNFWDHQGPDRASRINGFVANVALAAGSWRGSMPDNCTRIPRSRWRRVNRFVAIVLY